jgi:hypothetical protein
VHVEGAEAVADAVAAFEVARSRSGPRAPGPARAVGRPKREWTHLVEADHCAALGGPLVERQHPGRLGLVVGIRTGLPGAGAGTRGRPP